MAHKDLVSEPLRCNCLEYGKFTRLVRDELSLGKAELPDAQLKVVALRGAHSLTVFVCATNRKLCGVSHKEFQI